MFERWTVKSLIGCVALAGVVSLAWLAGCGGKKATEEEGGGTATTTSKAKAGPTAAEKLEAMEMMKELKAELFYEGDGKYEMDATYDPVTGKVTYSLTKARMTAGKVTPGGGVVVKDAYAGIYRSDRIQGPYELVGRFNGDLTALPEEMRLDDVRPMWFRAVIYNTDGKEEAYTDAVNVKIKPMVEKRPAPVKPAPKAGPAAKEKTEAKAPEEAAKPAEPVKVAVIMFLDDSKAPAEFLERAVTEATTKALAECTGLTVSRGDLVEAAMEQRKIPMREALKAASLKNLGMLLGADKLVLGSVVIEKDKIHLTATVQDATSEAQVKVADVTVGAGETDTLGETFVGKIVDDLGTKASEQGLKAFKERMKTLMDETQMVLEVRKRVASFDFRAAIAEFEKLPAADMKDAGLLKTMAQAYVEVNDYGKAADMTVAGWKIAGGPKRQDEEDRLVEVLDKIRDLKRELDLLGEVPLPDKNTAWTLGRELVKDAAGKTETMIVARSGKAVARRTWPLVGTVIDVQADKLVLDATKLGELLVVFTTGETNTLRNYNDVNQSKGRGGSVEMKNFEADKFTTTAYTEDGTKKWEVDGLMSPTVRPAADGEMIYGMRNGALVAISMEDGTVKWESTDKPMVAPERKMGLETALLRPWWRTWEIRVVGSYVVAWDPEGEQLHSFKKADGTHAGMARFQKLGDGQERMLIEDKGKLYYAERGQGTLKELTEQDLANPKGLQAHLELGANANSMVEDGTLYEMRQRTLIKRGAPGERLYYAVSSKAETGQFGWMEMLPSVEPPVMNKGKLYRLKSAETGKISSVVEAVDPTAGEMKAVDMAGMGINNVTPRLRLMNGEGILLGGQAALKVSDLTLAWVNMKLSSNCKVAAMNEKVAVVGPMLVQQETGEILGEMEAGEGFNWEEASESVAGNEVIAWANTMSVKNGKSVAKGRLVAFAPESKRLEQAKEERTAAAKREPMSVDKIEDAVWSSRVVPLPGVDRWNVQEMVARWKFQATGKPEDAIAYLTERAGQPARTVDGPFELIKLTKQYGLLGGDLAPYLASIEKLEKDFPKSGLEKSLNAERDTAKTEMEKLAQGKMILEGLRKAKDDPSKDWPCARGMASMTGSTGEGVTLTGSIKQKWTVKAGNASDAGSLIMAPGDKVVVLTERPGNLRVFPAEATADKKPLWETGGVVGATCYHGIVYATGNLVEARDLSSGIVLWRSMLTSPVGKHTCAMAAGNNMCVVTTGTEVTAYGWDTGKVLWKTELANCDRLEMYGDYVVAGSSAEAWVKFMDGKDGKELWGKEADSYAVYDNYLFGLKRLRSEQGLQEIRLQRWKIFVDAGAGGVPLTLPVRGVVKRVPSPVITKDLYVIAFGNQVIGVGTNGTTKWKHELPAFAGAETTVSPTTVYVGLETGDLWEYDLAKAEGSELARFPLMGAAPAAMGNGVLYVLRRGDLVAMEGTPAPYEDDYLKKMREPEKLTPPAATEEAAAPEAPAVSKAKVKAGVVVKEDCINSMAGLVAAIDSPDTMPAAFEVLMDYGGFDVLKTTAETNLLGAIETHNGQPGRKPREGQALGVEQAEALTNELVERGMPEGIPIVAGAVAGPTPVLAEPVAKALREADPAVYGQAVLTLVKQKAETMELAMHYPALRLLGKWGYMPAVPMLSALAENKKLDVDSRLECVQALGMYENGKTSQELMKVLLPKDTDNRLVQAAAEELAHGGNAGFTALSGVLANSSAKLETRIVAAGALGKMGGEQAFQLLLKTMGSGGMPEQLRAECALNAGMAGKEAAIEPLVKTMNMTTVTTLIRNGCLNGLAATKRRAAVPRIIEAIGSDADNGQFRRERASELLHTLTGADLGPDKDKWTQWYNVQKDKPWKTGLQ